MSQIKRWIVTTLRDRKVKDVSKELKNAGFKVDQEFDEIGGISGRASDEVAERMRSLPGVASVSPEDSVDIGPPDAPVTW